MTTLDQEFPVALRGYERGAVDDLIRDLRKELLSISARSTQLAAELKAANDAIEQLTFELEEVGAPSYTGVGAKAALILSTAEDLAIRLSSETETERERLLADTRLEVEELRGEAKGYYDSLVAEAQRRAERTLNLAKADSDDLIADARSRAVQIIEEATREAGSIRGATATEVAKLRANAKRQAETLIAKTERELAERKLLAQRDNTKDLDLQRAEELTSEQARIDLELELSARRAEAEEQYLSKHQEAVATTQKYLDDANAQLALALTRVNAARLEAETLEAAARSVTKSTTDSARAKADATIAAAEAESRSIVADAQRQAAASVKEVESKLRKIEREREAIKVYLTNLIEVAQRSTEEFK